MAKPDLDAMNLDELKALRKDVDRSIAQYEDRKRKDAMAALEAKAAEMGFALSDLTGSGAEAKKGKAAQPPKYAHPENPSMTWSGRGRQPKWILDAVADGRSKDDFLIGK